MTIENKNKIIVLAIVFAIAGVLGIANGSYLITAMYILTTIAAVFLIKDNDIYDVLYAVFLVSVFDLKNVFQFRLGTLKLRQPTVPVTTLFTTLTLPPLLQIESS